MFRDRALGITLIAMLLTSLACNAFAGNLEPLPPPPTPIVEANLVQTSEPAAAATLPALSPLPTPRVTVLVDLNVRSGPGVQYDRIGFILKDETLPVLGVHAPTGWWKIACPDTVGEMDCWVSGGDQYTKASHIEDLVELDAPSTPTPVPPTLEDGLGILAFIDDGALYSAKIDLTQNPPQMASDALRLSEIADVQSLSISPDGRRIAYISGSPEANHLHVVNTDAVDERELLNSTVLPLEIGQNNNDLAVLIDQVSWLQDSTTLAFNTVASNLTGPGILSQEDLWTVTIDGELSQIFPSGMGGGTFSLTSNNKVLLSRSDNIARADIDGSNDEVIIRFEPVNTASEYLFYPSLQQAEHGETFTYILDAQPWQPETWTTLWEISNIGLAGQLGSVEGATLFAPIIWSPDGNRLAFVQQPPDQDPTEMFKVVLADGKGINADPYAGGDSMVVHAWSPDSAKFIYSGGGFYAVGRVNAPPIQTILSSDQRVGDAQWAADETFIVAVGIPENNSWELFGSAVSGEKISLQSIRGFEPIFDIWQP